MLTNTPNNYKEILLKTINTYFDNNQFNDTWKNFLITLITKNYKNKFRPISLPSCILKLTERMINTRLQHFIEKNKLIPEAQNGFRKSKSCQNALTEILTDIHISFQNNLNTCCALIDIKSASDEVDPDILNNILYKLKIPIKIRSFIVNLLKGRRLYFKVGNKIIGPFTKNNGVPQGCVLSPLLYNLYVSELARIFNLNLHLVQYADDTFIYCSEHNMNSAILKLENSLQEVVNYFKKIKLRISPEKTKFTIFFKSPFTSLKNYTLNLEENTL